MSRDAAHAANRLRHFAPTELRPLIGKHVEITIRELVEPAAGGPDRWAALDALAGKDLIDPESAWYREFDKQNRDPGEYVAVWWSARKYGFLFRPDSIPRVERRNVSPYKMLAQPIALSTGQAARTARRYNGAELDQVSRETVDQLDSSMASK